MNKLSEFDKNISEKIFYSHLNKSIYKLIKLSTIGYGLVPFVLLTLAINASERVNYLFAILLTALIGFTNEHLLKKLIKRRRPQYKSAQLTSYSFPSTHSLSTVIAFLTFVNFLDGTSLLFVGLAFAYLVYVIFSRILMGYHYLGDIIGGIVLGCLLFLPIYFIN